MAPQRLETKRTRINGVTVTLYRRGASPWCLRREDVPAMETRLAHLLRGDVSLDRKGKPVEFRQSKAEV